MQGGKRDKPVTCTAFEALLQCFPANDRGGLCERFTSAKVQTTQLRTVLPLKLFCFEKSFPRPLLTMDPVTTIGLVSGILTFIDAADKILKLSWALYNSAEGSSEETEMRLKLADSTAVLWRQLSPPNQSAMAREDRALATLAQECNRLSNDIRDELQSLRPKRRKSKTQSGLAALKTLMVEPKIRSLETQLQRCRDQLHLHVSALSR